ncbi:MAG: GNAT family N-acetyltransferase [Lachnospiraceae bacterium]|nr:GNAT family N-acetyltransferase [Lachnospiraceae bacterium]
MVDISILNMDNPISRKYMEKYLPTELLENKSITVWCAHEQDTINGLMAFILESTVMRLVFLYVLPEYRRKGIANDMMDRFTYFLWSESYAWQLIMYFTGETEGLNAFFASRGDFFMEKTSEYVTVSPEKFYSSEKVQRLMSHQKKADSLFDVPMHMRKELCNYLVDHDIFWGKGVLSEGNQYLKDLCYCSITDDKIQSLVLVEKGIDNTLEIVFLFNRNGAISLAQVISNLVVSIYDRYPDSSISFAANERSVQLMRAFQFADYGMKNVYRASWNGMLSGEIEKLVLEEG